jgi:hypothetical protein
VDHDSNTMVTQTPYDPHSAADEHEYNGFSRNNSSDFFAVRGKEIPLSRTNTDGQRSSTNSLSDDEADEELNTIHKYVHRLLGYSFILSVSTDLCWLSLRTTHMANFYYKRGQSSENLQHF